MSQEFDGACPAAVLAEAQEVLTLLTASTGEGPEAALWRVTPSALHFFIATLLHVQSTQPLGPALAETLSICIQLKTQDSAIPAETPPLHDIAVEVINAACAGEPLRVLRAALMPALQGSWVAAHAAALMAQDSRYADLLGPQLPSVRLLPLKTSHARHSEHHAGAGTLFQPHAQSSHEVLRGASGTSAPRITYAPASV